MDEIRKDIKEVDERVDNVVERFYEWGEIQNTKWNAYEQKQADRQTKFEDRIIKKIDKLCDTIVQKTEMDSAMIAQLQELKIRVGKIETAREGHDKILATIGVKVDLMLSKLDKYDLSKMTNDIDAAHKRFIKIEPRVEEMESKGGRLAKKILYAIGIALVGSGIGYAFSLL